MGVEPGQRGADGADPAFQVRVLVGFGESHAFEVFQLSLDGRDVPSGRIFILEALCQPGDDFIFEREDSVDLFLDGHLLGGMFLFYTEQPGDEPANVGCQAYQQVGDGSGRHACPLARAVGLVVVVQRRVGLF